MACSKTSMDRINSTRLMPDPSRHPYTAPHTMQRDLERELWNLGREEQKLIAEIKKEAGKGASQKALKTLAGNLVQVRVRISFFLGNVRLPSDECGRSAGRLIIPHPPATQLRNQKERLLAMKAQVAGVGYKGSLMASQAAVGQAMGSVAGVGTRIRAGMHPRVSL